MIEQYVAGQAAEFEYILVLDVSRWGRFQDMDLSAYYTGLCDRHGKKVIYTTLGIPKGDDLVHYLHLNIERYRAATYSRELSDKVFRGCVKVSEQGFRAGGPPPYGLHRLLLDERRAPVQVLEPGQHKSIQNQRVTLTPGDEAEVEVIRRIFRWFVKGALAPQDIASALNADDVPSPGGATWRAGSVYDILRNDLYAGTMVYNKTTQKLQSPRRRNPKDSWVKTPDAFAPVVDGALYAEAQALLNARKEAIQAKYGEAGMVDKLRLLSERYGFVTNRLVAAEQAMASPATYAKRFGSLDMAYQRAHAEPQEFARNAVLEKLRARAARVDRVRRLLRPGS